MKKVINIALLILLGFTLSGAGCYFLMEDAAQISTNTHKNRPGRKFTVSVRACDEKTFKAYQEVLKEMGYDIYHKDGRLRGRFWYIRRSRNIGYGWPIDMPNAMDPDFPDGFMISPLIKLIAFYNSSS